MKINLGTAYKNKTKTYLLSTLLEYGGTFESKFTNMFKLAVGIGDFALIDMGLVLNDSIYILIDTKFSRTSFKDTMNWVRLQSYYELDYPFDDINSGHLHMLVIRIPERFEKTMKEFQNGKYSKMYEQEDLHAFFSKKDDEMGVLTRDPEMLVNFVSKVNEMFKTNVDYVTWGGEIDFSLKTEEEYFNFLLFKNTKK